MATQIEKLPARSIAFTYAGTKVTRDADGLINLTKMWVAAGSTKSRDPYNWSRKDGKEFIANVAAHENQTDGLYFRTVRGRTGGTYAHWQIALAYAKYLSPDFHRFVNEAFREWTEEKRDPGLKLERGIDGYLKRGYTAEWVGERLEGIVQRKALTATMADHNCRPNGTSNPFAEATRSISLQVLGQTPKEIKQSKGLAKSARTRDHLDKYELTRLRFAESEAERLIKTEAADGNSACVNCCRRAGRAVKAALQSLASG